MIFQQAQDNSATCPCDEDLRLAKLDPQIKSELR